MNVPVIGSYNNSYSLKPNQQSYGTNQIGFGRFKGLGFGRLGAGRDKSVLRMGWQPWNIWHNTRPKAKVLRPPKAQTVDIAHNLQDVKQFIGEQADITEIEKVLSAWRKNFTGEAYEVFKTEPSSANLNLQVLPKGPKDEALRLNVTFLPSFKTQMAEIQVQDNLIDPIKGIAFFERTSSGTTVAEALQKAFISYARQKCRAIILS